MGTRMKKYLVQATLNILKSEGIDSIKIRRIAKDVGCTSTVIYKHFEDLEHLIAFAAIRILKDYIQDFRELMSNGNLSIMEIYLCSWEHFAHYAFENIHIFELLFFGKYKKDIGDIILDYFHLFNDEVETKDFDALSASVLFSGDLRERSKILLRRAAAVGELSFGDVSMLSDMLASLFHGILLEYKDKYREPGMAQEGTEKFLNMLYSIADKYRLDP